jgi:hypothetical protein
MRQVEGAGNVGLCKERRRARVEQNEIDLARRKGGVDIGAIGLEGKLGSKMGGGDFSGGGGDFCDGAWHCDFLLGSNCRLVSPMLKLCEIGHHD